MLVSSSELFVIRITFPWSATLSAKLSPPIPGATTRKSVFRFLQKYYNKAGYVDPENTSSYTFDENATNVEGVESHSVKVTLTNRY